MGVTEWGWGDQREGKNDLDSQRKSFDNFKLGAKFSALCIGYYIQLLVENRLDLIQLRLAALS